MHDGGGAGAEHVRIVRRLVPQRLGRGVAVKQVDSERELRAGMIATRAALPVATAGLERRVEVVRPAGEQPEERVEAPRDGEVRGRPEPEVVFAQHVRRISSPLQLCGQQRHPEVHPLAVARHSAPFVPGVHGVAAGEQRPPRRRAPIPRVHGAQAQSVAGERVDGGRVDGGVGPRHVPCPQFVHEGQDYVGGLAGDGEKGCKHLRFCQFASGHHLLGAELLPSHGGRVGRRKPLDDESSLVRVAVPKLHGIVHHPEGDRAAKRIRDVVRRRHRRC